MKLPFSGPVFCVKESHGQAQFLRPGKQLGGRFFKPCFTSSTPGFAGWQGAEKSLQGRGRLWSCWPKSVQRLPKADPVSGINGMKLDGLIAAAHTPMNDDFSVNYELSAGAGRALGQAGHSRCLRRRHNRRVPVADDRRAAETVLGPGQHGKLSIENHLIQGWAVMIARRYAVRLRVPLSSMVRMTWMVLFLEEPPTNCGSVNMVSRLWSWVSFTPFEDVLTSL